MVVALDKAGGSAMFMFDRKQLLVAAALIFVMEIVTVVVRAAGY